MSLSLALDFDGSLVEPDPLRYRPGALEALAAFKAAGHRLVLHSCRCNPVDPAPTIEDEAARFYRTGEVPARVLDQWGRFVEMRAFLQSSSAWAMFDDVWQGNGKPLVDIFIDDKLEAPDWARLTQELAGQTP